MLPYFEAHVMYLCVMRDIGKGRLVYMVLYVIDSAHTHACTLHMEALEQHAHSRVPTPAAHYTPTHTIPPLTPTQA